MTDSNEVSITIHGLDVDNGNVRAEVFLEKFRTLIASLRLADSLLNGKKAHNLVIVDLSIGSAKARVREKVSVKRATAASSPYVGEAMRSIYNGDKGIDRFDANLIVGLAPLAKGVDRKFSHAEIEFATDNVIRIDDYFAKQVDRAVQRVRGKPEEKEKFFEGISLSSFDGVVKEIDARGALVRGKLILTAGGAEIDCIFPREDIPKLRENFEKRATITASAHYDGVSLLPARLDVRDIVPIKEQPDLLRWRGVLNERRAPRPEGL
jgi:hypothetical protein